MDGGFSLMLVPHFDVVRVLSHFHQVGVDNVVSYIRATKKKFCQMNSINFSKVPLVLEKLARFIAEIQSSLNAQKSYQRE